MPTGQTIINNTLTALGILEQGGTPSTSDSTSSLSELNDMWGAWGIDEGLIYAETNANLPVTPSQGLLTIGPLASGPGNATNYNGPVPSRIYHAKFVTATGGVPSFAIGLGGIAYAVGDTGFILGGWGTPVQYTVSSVSGGVVTGATYAAGSGYQYGVGYGSQTGGSQPGTGTGLTFNVVSVTATGQNRNELDIVNKDEYSAHSDLAAAAATPDELYPSFNPDVSGLMHLHLWPVPNVAGNLELDMAVPFNTWTLTTNYNVPQGYQDAIKWSLAFRLLSYFGLAVSQEIAQLVTANAQKAELRIREANKVNRQLPQGAEMMEPPQAQRVQR